MPPDRDARLAEALRANLRRRKLQARDQRAEGAAACAPSSVPDDPSV